MQINGIDCPSCGAPIIINPENPQARCEYCGRDVLLESQMIQEIGNKVANTFQEVETQTQVEIRHLQFSQELSMLQMQLSNLRTEKRGLERTGGRQIAGQIRQIQEEEKLLLNKIAAIQNVLNPPEPSDNSGKKPGFELEKNQVKFRDWQVSCKVYCVGLPDYDHCTDPFVRFGNFHACR